MEQVMFSIVVVCLNAGDRLAKTIDSVQGQTCGNYEILVKDGLSTDGSLASLPEDKRIRVFRWKDKGIYDAMNQAVREVKGDYVYFLNCGDVFYDANVLSEVRKELEAVQGKAAADRDRKYIFYGDIYERLTGERVASNPSIDAFGCYRNVPCHQACFYSAALVREKAFDPDYRVRADYEHFLWCYLKGGAETVCMPLVIADYEGGGFSETKENRKRSAKEHREIVRRYMTAGQIFRYRLLLLVTLAPLRTWLARNKTTAHIYNRLKKKMYGRQRTEG